MVHQTQRHQKGYGSLNDHIDFVTLKLHAKARKINDIERDVQKALQDKNANSISSYIIKKMQEMRTSLQDFSNALYGLEKFASGRDREHPRISPSTEVFFLRKAVEAEIKGMDRVLKSLAKNPPSEGNLHVTLKDMPNTLFRQEDKTNYVGGVIPEIKNPIKAVNQTSGMPRAVYKAFFSEISDSFKEKQKKLDKWFPTLEASQEVYLKNKRNEQSRQGSYQEKIRKPNSQTPSQSRHSKSSERSISDKPVSNKPVSASPNTGKSQDADRLNIQQVGMLKAYKKQLGTQRYQPETSHRDKTNAVESRPAARLRKGGIVI